MLGRRKPITDSSRNHTGRVEEVEKQMQNEENKYIFSLSVFKEQGE